MLVFGRPPTHQRAEALIRGIPSLLQPFSCVFYPLESLPRWAQGIAGLLPGTYAFDWGQRCLSGCSVGRAPTAAWATGARIETILPTHA